MQLPGRWTGAERPDLDTDAPDESGSSRGESTRDDADTEPAAATTPSERRWFAGRRWTPVIAGAAVLGGALIGVGLLVVLGGDEDERRAAAALITKGDRGIRSVSIALGRADTIADITAAGRMAEKMETSVRESEVRTLADLDDTEDLRNQTRAVADAQVRVLATMGQAADLRPEDLARWKAIRERVSGEAAKLDAVTRAPVTGSEPVRTPDASPIVLTALTDVSSVVRSAQRRLRSWKRKYDAARTARRGDLRALDGYAESMKSLLARYDDMRSEMDDFIRRIDDGGVTFADAYDFLGTAASARESIRKGIQALDAPTSVAAAHNRIEQVIVTAADAVNDAYEGTIDYELDDEGEHSSYRDTPGWREFSRHSSEISGEYAAARTAWTSEVAAQRKRIADRKLPEAPDV